MCSQVHVKHAKCMHMYTKQERPSSKVVFGRILDSMYISWLSSYSNLPCFIHHACVNMYIPVAVWVYMYMYCMCTCSVCVQCTCVLFWQCTQITSYYRGSATCIYSSTLCFSTLYTTCMYDVCVPVGSEPERGVIESTWGGDSRHSHRTAIQWRVQAGTGHTSTHILL